MQSFQPPAQGLAQASLLFSAAGSMPDLLTLLLLQGPQLTLRYTRHWWSPTAGSWAWTCLMGGT